MIAAMRCCGPAILGRVLLAPSLALALRAARGVRARSRRASSVGHAIPPASR